MFISPKTLNVITNETTKVPNYKAKYVNGIKIFIALIKSTANNIKTTIENIIALIGDVAELT